MRPSFYDQIQSIIYRVILCRLVGDCVIYLFPLSSHDALIRNILPLILENSLDRVEFISFFDSTSLFLFPRKKIFCRPLFIEFPPYFNYISSSPWRYVYFTIDEDIFPPFLHIFLPNRLYRSVSNVLSPTVLLIVSCPLERIQRTNSKD